MIAARGNHVLHRGKLGGGKRLTLTFLVQNRFTTETSSVESVPSAFISGYASSD
jgi:hypothetical protein